MSDVRVLLIDLERAWRGGQEQALLLMSGLQQRHHDVELVAVCDSAIASRARAAGIRVHAVSSATRRIGAASEVRKLIGAGAFAIVHANEAHALTAAWLARSHRHASLVVARRVVFPLSHGRISLARYRAAAKILAISVAVRKQLLAAGLTPERIEIVPDGVEVPAIIAPETRVNARKHWGFRENEIVIECVAALIEAFAKLRRTPGMANCRLLLAGDGPLRVQLERQAREAGLESAIQFAGFVQDIESVYLAADLFVFPSLQEGVGSSLLRAMAFGLPVLALARGGMTEVIEDGKNGILVQEAAAQALAWALAGMVGEPELRQQLGQAARETAAARYSADRMVDHTATIFEQLIAQKRPNQ
jgi:glycosyltransferase involved in cell wall biosynthesis